MLARGELRMIGATTLDEYRNGSRRIPLWSARFQQVYVGEPSVEDTIAILRGLRERYDGRITSGHHRCRAGRGGEPVQPYITSRQLPDKRST